MHRRVMHMHFSLLQQLHDHFPLVDAARSIYGELLFLLIVSTVDFSFYFYFQLSATSLLSYIYPGTNNSIENDIKINENSNFESISFYSFLRNSLKTIKFIEWLRHSIKKITIFLVEHFHIFLVQRWKFSFCFFPSFFFKIFFEKRNCSKSFEIARDVNSWRKWT